MRVTAPRRLRLAAATMLPVMLEAVGLAEFKQEGRRRRREVLLAALAATATTQAELVRRMTLEGERTAPTTVNRWCTGVADIDQDTLRYVLHLLGLPVTWEPPKEG